MPTRPFGMLKSYFSESFEGMTGHFRGLRQIHGLEQRRSHIGKSAILHFCVLIVADEDDMLVGFVCVQLKKSFCYDEYMPEITEVYVKPAYRKRGLASEMITFAEAYCSKNYPLDKYELLTGQENLVAQTVYNKLGYVDDNELHLSKRVKK